MPVTDRNRFEYFARTLEEEVFGAETTEPVLLSGQVAVQITSPLTHITVQMERSTSDPATSPNWAPIDNPIEGNPSAGMPVEGFFEPAVAWWRARVINMQGVAVLKALISISGGGA